MPSLLGVGYHAPYFHDGSAETLEDVFTVHQLPGGGVIAGALAPSEQADLLVFLRSLDGTTPILRSETDSFKEPLP